jgi:23S rRNA-/tRNA-specific pseudouridylate synthase
VRVHAYALGIPLLGDTLYCVPKVERDTISLYLHRPALHAYSLAFEFEEKPFSFIADYPLDFEKTLEAVRLAH